MRCQALSLGSGISCWFKARSKAQAGSWGLTQGCGGFVPGQLEPRAPRSRGDPVALPLARVTGLLGGHRTKCCLLLVQRFAVGILGCFLEERAVRGNRLPAVQQNPMSCLRRPSVYLCNVLAKYRSKRSCGVRLLFNCKKMRWFPKAARTVCGKDSGADESVELNGGSCLRDLTSGKHQEPAWFSSAANNKSYLAGG